MCMTIMTKDAENNKEQLKKEFVKQLCSYFLKHSDNTPKNQIYKLQKIIEYAQFCAQFDKEKYHDAVVSYRWLIGNLTHPSRKQPLPTKKQRENAIDVTVELEEQVENDENVKTRIKAFAVFVKFHFDKRNF